MAIELEPCLIDRYVTTSGPNRGGYENLEFECVGRLGVDPAEDLFVGSTPEARAARNQFATLAANARGTPIGMIRLRNVYLVGLTGAIIDRAKGRYLWGQTIGWAGPTVATRLLRSGYGAVESEGKVLLEPENFEDARTYDCLRLISAAGQHVYGHWLLDVIPRLLLSNELSGQPEAPFYAPRIPDWGLALATAAGIDVSNRVQSGKELVFVRRLEIPTFIRKGVVLDEVRSVATWQRLKSGQARDLTRCAGEEGSLLYVSRANWGSRTLSNAREVEQWVKSYGFRIVHPETMTLRQQMDAFAAARLIIGEDGSGMHNSVFSDRHAHIGVISMGRTNFYHASIANTKRHSVGYLPAVRTDLNDNTASWALPRNVLEQYLDDINFQRRTAG